MPGADEPMNPWEPPGHADGFDAETARTDHAATDHAATERAAQALLNAFPEARLLAVVDGMRVVPLPDTLPITPAHRLLPNPRDWSRTPEHRGGVAQAWARARSRGVSQTRSVLRSGDAGNLYLFDLRSTHGVILAVFVDDREGAPLPDISGTDAPAPTRVGHIRRDHIGYVLELDQVATAMLGWSTGDLAGRPTVDVIHRDDYDSIVESWVGVLADPAVPSRWRGRHLCKDGTWLWVEQTHRSRLDDPAHRDVVSEIVDISPEYAARDAPSAGEERMLRLAEALPVGVFTIDVTGQVTFSNGRLHEILGAPRAERLADQLAHLEPGDRALVERAVEEVLRTRAEVDVEISAVGDGGGVRICRLALRPLTSERGTVTGAIGCLSDVTESLRARGRLEERAEQDSLTGCSNRASVLAALDRMVAQAAERTTGTAVVLVDVDGFADLNDRYGYAAGDEVLRAVGGRVQRSVRDEDHVGRIGGDEFLVACPGVRDADVARRLGERLADVLRSDVGRSPQPGGPAALSVPVQASVGVAWTTDAGVSGGQLVSAAGEAMQRSKRQGAGKAVVVEVGDRR
ncbi:MAG: sensor domain-containing diguanylate cyclase [Actinobacteria bacterium]|nr:sensor domain-containing diguanylate cyclase [Actinomycetota bacterium]